MHLKIVPAVLAIQLVIAVACIAQVTPPPPLTVTDDDELRVETQLVDVPVSVTDNTGKPILRLKKENFSVFEDGKQQEIASFFSTEAPFEVALLLDTSGSTRSELRLIRRAAQLFIDSLRPGDRVAIIAFGTGIDKDPVTGISRSFPITEMISGLTDDRSRLKEALETVGTSNGTPFYDALLQIADHIFGEAPADRFRGRRALVALTDGVDSTSDADFEEVAEVIAGSGITTYFVKLDTRIAFEDGLLGDCASSTQFSKAQMKRYYDLFPKEFRVERVTDFCRLGNFERLDISKRLYLLAEDQMAAMAKNSGGRVFPAGDLGEARDAFQKVAADIGTSYSLGYYSTNEKKDGKLRKITVETTGLPAGSVLRAREGYIAPKKMDN